MKLLHTPAEVISAAGGPAKFAKWWGENTDLRTVCKWRDRKRFPRETFVVMSTRLRHELNLVVPPSAFGMRGSEPTPVREQGQAA